jgi:hypothetical protein
MRRRRKRYRTPEEKHKRRYRFFQTGFFALLITLGATCFFNYDYWIFKFLIAVNYSFTGALNDLYADAIGEENFKGYYQDFDRVVMASFSNQLYAYNQDRYTYLYTPQHYTYSIQSEREDAKLSEVRELTPDTVYLYLTNISSGTKKFVYDNREQLAGYKNLVFDLRGNYGGLLADFYSIADLFTGEGFIHGHEEVRLPFITHAVRSKGERYFTFDNIVILQDASTASASEGLINSLKQNLPNVRLLGENTFGKGIGQVTIPLTGGYAMRATVLLVTGPDGVSIHGKGIAPDYAPETDDWVSEALEIVESE